MACTSSTAILFGNLVKGTPVIPILYFSLMILLNISMYGSWSSLVARFNVICSSTNSRLCSSVLNPLSAAAATIVNSRDIYVALTTFSAIMTFYLGAGYFGSRTKSCYAAYSCEEWYSIHTYDIHPYENLWMVVDYFGRCGRDNFSVEFYHFISSVCRFSLQLQPIYTPHILRNLDCLARDWRVSHRFKGYRLQHYSCTQVCFILKTTGDLCFF